MKLVLDTCILKLATLPAFDNPAALIVELGLRGLAEWWATPAILAEYSLVLADEPEFLAEAFEIIALCYPLTEFNVIRHEPDNRFAECALAVAADYLITVNIARGHFDRVHYGSTRVCTPGAFVNLPTVQGIVSRLRRM